MGWVRLIRTIEDRKSLTGRAFAGYSTIHGLSLVSRSGGLSPLLLPFVVWRNDVRHLISLVLLFLSSLGLSVSVSAQQVGSTGDAESSFQLEQNYPNPFNPETRIPFVLGDRLFGEGRPVRVSVRIYNVLRQFVAAPTALNHTLGEGLPVEDLEYLTPGRHEVYWDGRDRAGNQVASGVYFIQLVVNGQTAPVRKMFVTK